VSMEAAVRDYLRTVPAVMGLLNNEERRLNMEWSGDARATRVTLYRAGGNLHGYAPLDFPVITFHCYGSTRSAAATVAEAVAAAVNNIDSRHLPLTSGSVESTTYLPTEDGAARYVVTSSVTAINGLAA
jgi:hypothetical protein